MIVTAHAQCSLPGYAGGIGPVPADLMFVGEALGENEEFEGKPFVGRAGARLDVLLTKYLGVAREDVYITNLVKHRPPRNRRPKKAEIAACAPYLADEIRAVLPKIIVPMGAAAVAYFLPGMRLAKSHGQPVRVGGRTVIVPWYHPAAGFRSTKVWRASVEDAADFWERIKALDAEVHPNYTLTDTDGMMEYVSTYIGGSLGFDIETTSWRVAKAGRFGEIVGYSLSGSALEAVYAAADPRDIAGILSNSYIHKICHNAGFEYRQLRKAGIELRGFDDTMGLAYVLGLQELGLKDLASKFLHVPVRRFDDVTRGVDHADREALAACLADNYSYGCADSDNTRRLYFLLRKQADTAGVLSVYEQIERPLIPVLARMEERGVRLDVPRLVRLRERVAKIKALAKTRAEAALGQTLTREKLARRLAELGAPISKRTAKKQLPKTDYDTLTRIRSWNPALIDAVTTYYRYEKLLAFPVTLLQLVDADDHLRPSYHQFGYMQDDSDSAPVTGRLSSSHPNVQQIPHSGDRFLTWWGRRLRACFLPEPGEVWVKIDFAQQEARIIAVLADDRQLKQDFADGIDVYSPAASALYGMPITKRSHPQERFFGKTFFLAHAYGAKEDKVTEIDSRLTLAQARAGVARFDARYPGVASFYEKQKAFVLKHGYVETVLGRKRWIPEVYSNDRMVREHGFRQAVNSPVQGTGADILKIVMAIVDNQLDASKASMRITVHDELGFSSRPEYTDTVVQIAREAAAEVSKRIGIELPIEIGIGPSWATAG